MKQGVFGCDSEKLREDDGRAEEKRGEKGENHTDFKGSPVYFSAKEFM